AETASAQAGCTRRQRAHFQAPAEFLLCAPELQLPSARLHPSPKYIQRARNHAASHAPGQWKHNPVPPKQNASAQSALKTRRMLAQRCATAACFYADQANVLVLDEFIKRANGI